MARPLHRSVDQQVDGLRDEPRSGAPRLIDDERIEKVIVQTLEGSPPDATHWSSRGMVRASGLSVPPCSASGRSAQTLPLDESASDILASIERFCIRNGATKPMAPDMRTSGSKY